MVLLVEPCGTFLCFADCAGGFSRHEVVYCLDQNTLIVSKHVLHGTPQLEFLCKFYVQTYSNNLMSTRNAVTMLLDKLAKVKNLTPKRATTSSDLASSRSMQLAACIAETSKLQQRLAEAYGTVLLEA